MSCARSRRAILDMTRFGEFGPDSELHIDHLSSCRECRDEVGCDRELIRQLRAALAARVEGVEPPSTVWNQVLVLAQQPERSRLPWPWRRSGDALGAARTLSAMAGTGLALVLALNTQVVTLIGPSADVPSPAPITDTVGVPSAWDRLPRLAGGGNNEAAEQQQMVLNAQPDPEGIVLNVDASNLVAILTAPPDDDPGSAPEEPAPATVTPPPLAHEPALVDQDVEPDANEAQPAESAIPEAGEPT
ncbi:MAG TPA: hypothetical protein VHR55_05515 [Candidatus Limnocylindria bacterium]|nr:hypothetical protein [Candidatus Limnocylindria bacterium]